MLLQKHKQKSFCDPTNHKSCIKKVCSGFFKHRKQALNFKTNKHIFLANESTY